MLPDLVKPGLGGRWECYSCGSKFYDLGPPEPTCPKCGADQRDKPREKTSSPPTPPPERRGAPPSRWDRSSTTTRSPAEEYDADEEDLGGIDDDAFLTETPEPPTRTTTSTWGRSRRTAAPAGRPVDRSLEPGSLEAEQAAEEHFLRVSAARAELGLRCRASAASRTERSPPASRIACAALALALLELRDLLVGVAAGRGLVAHRLLGLRSGCPPSAISASYACASASSCSSE